MFVDVKWISSSLLPPLTGVFMAVPSAETFKQKHILLMKEMDVEASIIPWFDRGEKSIRQANWLEFTQQTRADVISTPDNEARKETS